MGKLFWLKLSATLASMIIGGCMPPIGNQTPTAPQVVKLQISVDGEGKINVGGDASITAKSANASADDVCPCGCGLAGCTCQVSPTSAAGPLRLSSPVKLKQSQKPEAIMFTDFGIGQGCAACDAMWRDWQTLGKSWPFELKKVQGNRLGGSSPTVQFPDGRVWRPQFYTGAEQLMNAYRGQ